MPDELFTVRLKNLRELQLDLKGAERDIRLGVRSDIRGVAEPTARLSEELALQRIRRMPRSPQWARMRIGLTQRLLYVAPRQRGLKSKAARAARTPAANRAATKFADRLMGRAMEPALEREAPHIEAHVEQALDRMAARFNQGGT